MREVRKKVFPIFIFPIKFKKLFCEICLIISHFFYKFIDF